MVEKIETQPEEIVEELPKVGFLEKLKTHKFKVLGGVLGIFVFAGAVFGVYKFGQRQIQPGPQPTPGLVATPTPDPTADWKTYQYTKHSEYAYSIKYPPNWSFEEGIESLVDFGPVTFNSPGKSYVYSRVTLLKEGGFTFEDVINDAKSYLDDLKEETIKAQGLDAIKLSGTMNAKSNPAVIGYYSEQIFIKKRNNIYKLGLMQDPQEGYKQTINLMLSTFRFLEKSDEAQISEVLNEYIPEHSLVKVFEFEGLKILGDFAKVTVAPKDVVTDKAMVILEKIEGEWTVIWGPGTAIGKTDPILERIPEGLLR